MSLWMRMTIALAVCAVITFVLTWAIREGGSFAFLRPSHWRNRGEDDGRRPPLP